MEGEPEPDQPNAPQAARTSDSAIGFWPRVREHKIIQWGVGYLGVSLALAQGQELLANAFDWPAVATRIVLSALIVGFPIAITLAWYRGHRGLTQMSAGELAIVSVLLLIGSVFFAVALPSRDDRPADAIQADAPSVAVVAQPTQGAVQSRPVLENSVAVLPLDNLSGTADSAQYARALHAEMIGQLTKLSNVTVIGRDSVLRYEANRPSPQVIAAELGAESLLVGTFQYAAGQIRIVVQLVDPLTGTNLWSDEYQSPFADIFTVQADIAMNVANSLAVEFSAAEQQAIEKPPTSSPEAYALYLEAWDLIAGFQGEDRLRTAHALLDQALALDPEFASAYGAKATIFAVGIINTNQGTGVNAEERAPLERQIREYANRALDLDASQPLARSALRTINLLTWRWSEYARAIGPRDEPGLAPVEVWATAWMGNGADAVRIGEKKVALDPGNPGAFFALGVAQAYAGDRLGSIQTFRRALQLSPSSDLFHAWIGYNHVVLGNTEDAVVEFQLLEQMLGDNRQVAFLPELAHAYARLGRRDDAERVFDDIRRAAEDADLGAGTWALAYWAIGDKTRALESLRTLAEKTRNHEVDPGLINAMNLKMNFLADPALETPEMMSALSKIAGD
jgi:TolB-like protein/Flp pilus assembly protein TadD